MMMMFVTERRRPRQSVWSKVLSEQGIRLQVLPVLQPATLLAAVCVCSVRHAEGGYTDTGTQVYLFNKKLRDRGDNSVGRCVYTLMRYTRLASAVAVCIATRGRYTQLAWLANPNPNPNPTNSSYG